MLSTLLCIIQSLFNISRVCKIRCILFTSCDCRPLGLTYLRSIWGRTSIFPTVYVKSKLLIFIWLTGSCKIKTNAFINDLLCFILAVLCVETKSTTSTAPFVRSYIIRGTLVYIVHLLSLEHHHVSLLVALCFFSLFFLST